MAHGQETGSGKPALRQALQARGPDLDLIFGLPSGPAACDGRIEGRTHVSTRPRATPLLKISLAPQGASTHVVMPGLSHDDAPSPPREHGRIRRLQPRPECGSAVTLTIFRRSSA